MKQTETQNTKTSELKALVRGAPQDSGVYLMRDSAAKIIYVGKAKVLRNRLSSYFTGRKDAKTQLLVAHIDNIEWIITADEYSALLLESTLIKEHNPRYNLDLKDGKSYPSIRITNEEYPRVFRTRRIIYDGSTYFGPFPSAQTIDLYLETIKKLFPLRRCVNLRKREPCLYYHIGRCSAPCAGKVNHEEYAQQIEAVKKLLSGKSTSLEADLKKRMQEESAKLNFEAAAQLRDSLEAITVFRGKDSTVDFDPQARDYISYERHGELIIFVVFQMRDGKLTGRDLFRSQSLGNELDVVQEFFLRYYSANRQPPPRIFWQGLHTETTHAELHSKKTEAAEYSAAGDMVAENPETNSSEENELSPLEEMQKLISKYFNEELKTKVKISIPHEKRHTVVLRLAGQNAREELVKQRREQGDPEAIKALRDALGLKELPTNIEGFDIAQLGGKHTVASLVSFKNGVPDKKNYRYFKIRSLKGAIDDYESLREAVARRYTRLINEGANLPDLILIDGGKGQLNAVREILDTLGVDSELASLAKENEEVYRPDLAAPIVMPHDSPALRILVAVRDETHRFATGLNQKLRAGALKFTKLESIPGIGKKRSEQLMQHFHSIENIKKASDEELAQVLSMSREKAATIKASL